MQTPSPSRRAVRGILAGSLFIALLASGCGPALAAPDLTVTKTPDGATIHRGGVATFTIAVTNPDAENASNVELEDWLPGAGVIDWGIADQTLPFGCDIEGDYPEPQVLYCDPGSMLSGETESVTVSGVTPNSCIVLNNTATATYDDHVPVSDDGSIATTGCAGRMTGGGSIIADEAGATARGNAKHNGTRITHGFELRCDASDPRQNLEINWPGSGNQNNFHLTSLTDAVCSDDPGIDPKPPQAGFDTFSGTGLGTCNGQPAEIVFVFTDAGEPGKLDTAEYHISGACTLDAGPANLANGNQQAHGY